MQFGSGLLMPFFSLLCISAMLKLRMVFPKYIISSMQGGGSVVSTGGTAVS